MSETNTSQLLPILEENREEILEEWKRRVIRDPAVPEANRLSEAGLSDHIPKLLDDLIQRLREFGRFDGETGASTSTPLGHAAQRYLQNYSLDSAMREWGHFRTTLLDLFEKAGAPHPHREIRLIHSLLDEGIYRVAVSMHQRLQRESERRAVELEAVIDAVPDGVLVGDEGGWTRGNPRALEQLGLPDTAELNRPIDELTKLVNTRDPQSGEPLAAENSAWARALRGEHAIREVVVKNASTGVDIVLRTAAAPILEGGKIVGVVAINTDITEQKRRESALAEEVGFRERFMGILGHDLRNPLASIVTGVGNLLRQESLADKHLRILKRMLTSAFRIQRMIEQLLDLTRSRLGGGIPIHPVECDLAKILEDVIDELQPSHPDRTLLLRVAGNAGGIWDPDRLEQVASNLIGNALNYGTPGTAVEIVATDEDVSVRLAVTNEGPPIASEVAETLFDPFHTFEPESRRKGQGLGLGLFIAREVARAHGGQISVSSVFGEDAHGTTTFTVRLPRKVPTRERT